MNHAEVQKHAILQRALARCTGPIEGEVYFVLFTHCDPSASWNPGLALLRGVYPETADRYTPSLAPGQVRLHPGGLAQLCVQRCAGVAQDSAVDGFKHREVYLREALQALTGELAGRRATVVMPPTYTEIDTYNEITHVWMDSLGQQPALGAVVALDLDVIADQLDAQATKDGATDVIVQACNMQDTDRRTYPSSEYLDANLEGTLGVMLTGAENGTVVNSGYILTSVGGTDPLRLWRWGLSSRPSQRTAHDALLRLGEAVRRAGVLRIVLPTDVVRMLTRTPEMHNAYLAWIEMLIRSGVAVRELDLGERSSVRAGTRPPIDYARITDFFKPTQ